MAIKFDKQTFQLHTKNTTYQLQIDTHGRLMHLHYGKKIEDTDLSYMLDEGIDRSYNINPYEVAFESNYFLNALPQEYPTLGYGDFRTPAIIIKNADGTTALDLHYKEHELVEGKYELPGLPATFGEAESLKITLEDTASGIEVDLLYAVFVDKDIITRATIVRNVGYETITLKKVQSLSMDFLYGEFDLIHFQGHHVAERLYERTPIGHHLQHIGSNRGISSHQHNPGFILANPGTIENFGDCYGFNLVYSGNFNANIEKSETDSTRVTLGLGDDTFSWKLEAGQSFTAPEAVLSYSANGFAQLSQNFHKMVKENLSRSKFTNTKRPILINNWEATYFDFTGEKLVEIANAAKAIGVDMLVMDDGWFGNRFDDNRALGDWFVNEEKLGGSLKGLVEKINALDMKFGIWFEPEMVSEESKLFKAHPDWAYRIPGRNPSMGRKQLLLDLSKTEVQDYLYETISAVLDSTNIEYVKWDMNRAITHWFNGELPTDQLGELQHRYMLGLYRLFDKVTSRFPNILFEGCAGGGGRFDLGMLYYQPQIWTSDNTDAINRLKIQYGTSFFYPISSMGSHVSVTPNHQTGRSTPLDTRFHVAMSGTFGYELDLTKMSTKEKEDSSRYTALYKQYQQLIFSGDYYRLTSPFDTKQITAWQITAQDQSESLLTVVATDVIGNSPNIYLKLQGLDEQADYEINGKTYSGSALMNVGFKAMQQYTGNFPSAQFYIKRK